MTWRGSFRPSRPDLDRFLFATSGDEMSVISVLTRLGLDPLSLSNREAIEQLALLIAELPGLFRPLGEEREIADRLIQLLSRHDADVGLPRRSQFARVTSERYWRGHPNSG